MARDEAYQEALQRIEQARKDNSTELDLSYLELTEIPEAIASLTQLRELTLSNNQLRELPEEIASLTQLEYLFLPGNKLTVFPEDIVSLSQLQGLYLHDNQLTALPEEIASLTQLRELTLSNNQLRELPEEIAFLTKLQRLTLSNNQLTALPEAIASLTQLQELDLSGNQLRELPEAIISLTQLQRLTLSNNQLTTLPKAIISFSKLKNLNLEENEFAELPEVITRLSNLKYLDLNYNNISCIPDSISQLRTLKTFKIGVNQLTSVSEKLSHLKKLEFLNLGTNKLRDLPSSLSELTNLRTLYIDTNNFSEIPPFVFKLCNLETLWCHINNLTDLPVELLSLERLRDLSLNRNPLNPELSEANKQGLNAVIQYLRAKSEAKITLNEAKLILIGEGEVGKTCLLGALRGDDWVEGRPTTHGIEIKPVTVIDPESGTEITLNGWDFGGQRVYRPTHQLFFSAPAVYLVVWKPREGPQQGFVKEWITLIKNREPDAKVLVVATHGGPGQRQPDINKQELLERFGEDAILGFFHIDSKPNEENNCCNGIAELKDAIAKVAMSLPEMGRTVPKKWQQVREILQTNTNPYLPYQDVMAICQEQGIDESQAKLFIKISHELGHLIHYDYDSKLNNIVILKPDWLAKAISYVLDDPAIRTNNGLVNFEDLSKLWSNPPFEGETGYPEHLHEVFLRLMERFELSYKVVLERSENNNTSLIAQLVPDNPLEFSDWKDTPNPGEKQQVQICRIVDERGQFAAAEGLFYRLIVRLHKYSLGRENYENSIHWQRGLMLDNDYNGRALLEYIDTDIKITVRAVYPERFLSYLTEEIIWLVKDFWQGLRCNVMVSCIKPCGINSPGKGLFEVQKLIESKKKNRHEYPCPLSGCDEWQNIDALLSNAPIIQPQELLQQNLLEIQNSLQEIRRDTSQGIERLSQGQNKILSQVDQQFAEMMQMLTDEAKDGPRLFSFKPIEPGWFDRPKWIGYNFQLTLWCEHSRLPLPALNPDNPKKGVYELTLTREWLAKAAPVLKVIFKTLSLVAPVAASATNLMMDDETYKGVKEELDLAQKSLTLADRGGAPLLDWQTRSDAPELSQGEAIRAQGYVLRELHALLKQQDPSFGGLIRVQNPRREFLWVHPQFKDEY